MTDEQLKKGQEIKKEIEKLQSELDKFKLKQPQGFNVILYDVGTLVEDVKQVFVKHLNEYNEKFRKL